MKKHVSVWLVALALQLSCAPIALLAKEAHSEGGPAPTAVLDELREGNKRFAAGEAKHAGQAPADREKLAKGQKPSAIVLSCSDSRVPPELVFDEGLGRLFTVRVAGNVVDAATVASIEYAVEHLGSKLIVVLGHESCGAVKAALETPAGKSAGSRDLDTLIGSVRHNLGGKFTLAAAGATLKPAVKANAVAVAEDLVVRSKIIRAHLDAGKLMVVAGVYSLETGLVEFQ